MNDCSLYQSIISRFKFNILFNDLQLEDFARNRAIEIAVKDGTNFYHPDDLEYGENLAWNSIEPVDCRVAIELWYDEWKIYNFAKPNITSRNGHFTQVVSIQSFLFQ